MSLNEFDAKQRREAFETGYEQGGLLTTGNSFVVGYLSGSISDIICALQSDNIESALATAQRAHSLIEGYNTRKDMPHVS